MRVVFVPDGFRNAVVLDKQSAILKQIYASQFYSRVAWISENAASCTSFQRCRLGFSGRRWNPASRVT